MFWVLWTQWGAWGRHLGCFGNHWWSFFFFSFLPFSEILQTEQLGDIFQMLSLFNQQLRCQIYLSYDQRRVRKKQIVRLDLEQLNICHFYRSPSSGGLRMSEWRGRKINKNGASCVQWGTSVQKSWYIYGEDRALIMFLSTGRALSDRCFEHGGTKEVNHWAWMIKYSDIDKLADIQAFSYTIPQMSLSNTNICEWYWMLMASVKRHSKLHFTGDLYIVHYLFKHYNH